MITGAEFDYTASTGTVLVHLYFGDEYISMLDCSFESLVCLENTELSTFWLRVIGKDFFALKISESVFNYLNEQIAEVLSQRASK